MLFRLGKNIGYEVDGVFGTRTAGNLAEKQEQAWEHVRAAIDQGLPCYGWELEIPEYYVVYGYDDIGYYFSGPGLDGGGGPRPWQELGDTEIGVLEMYSVRPGPAADDVQTVKEALAFALEHATGPEKWIFPDYRSGPAGYDTWIAALEGGQAHSHGAAYNAAVWSECRGYAVLFLQEAKERLGGPAAGLFEEAVEHYQVVSDNLKRVEELFPFHGLEPGHVEDPARIRGGAEALRVARAAEAAGLETLRKIVGAL